MDLCWKAALVLPAPHFLERKAPSGPYHYHFLLELKDCYRFGCSQKAHPVVRNYWFLHSNCSHLVGLLDWQNCCCYCSMQCYFMSFQCCSGPRCPGFHYSEPDFFSAFSFFHRSAWLLACTKGSFSSVWAIEKYISCGRHENTPTSQVQLRFHNLHNKPSTCPSRSLL